MELKQERKYRSRQKRQQRQLEVSEQAMVKIENIQRRIREVTLNLSQLRIEREAEAQRRAEEDRLRAEQERELQQELIRLTVEMEPMNTDSRDSKGSE